MAEFTFQLELEQDLSTRQVAQMFNDFGDVTVVKTATCTYWIDFESFDASEIGRSAAASSLSQGAALGSVM